MRASLDISPVGAGLKKDHRISEWFWDHQFGFCQRHQERDRKRHIAECMMAEAQSPKTTSPAPELAVQPVTP